LAIITLEINGMVHYNIMEDTFIVWQSSPLKSTAWFIIILWRILS
jgi:hypothetical protein